MTIYYFIYRLLNKLKPSILSFILCTICLPFIALPQPNADETKSRIDSLETLLPSANIEKKLELTLELAKSYIEKSPQKTIEYGLQAVNIAAQINDMSKEATAYYITGIGYFYLRETNTALESFNKALILRQETGKKQDIAKSLKGLGIAHTTLGNNSEALNHFLQALKLFKELDIKNEIANVQMDIVRIYGNLGDYEKALEFSFQAIKLAKLLEDVNVANMIMNTGVIYFELKNYEKAIEYYNNALELYTTEKSNIGAAMVYNNIGIVYQRLNDNNKALENFNKSLTISRAHGFQSEISSALINLGIIC